MSGSPAPGPTVEPSGPRGPLRGVRVLELASIGPIPFCGMVLSDMGADVIRLDRMAAAAAPPAGARSGPPLGRRRPQAAGRTGGRPRPRCRLGRAHRGLPAGRRRASRRRPGRVPRSQPAPRIRADDRVGSLGPLADRAGHDINYLAVAGALGSFGRAGEPPVPPLSIIADLGAGGLLLAYGIACALFERATSGAGQIVDAAMLDGTVLFMGPWLEAQQAGTWNDAWHEQPRLGRAVLRQLPVRRWRVRRGRCAGAAVLRPAARGPRSRRSVDPGSERSANWPALRALFAERFPRGPATSGPTASRAWMHASRRSEAGRGSPPSADRRRRRSSPSTAWSILRRRAASIGHPGRSPVASASQAPTPTRSSPISATTSRPCATAGTGGRMPEAAVLSAR